jgi:hypothetical protein
MSAPKVWTGACHCGTVRFTVKLVDGLDKPRRCNCSLCRMRGAVVVSARVGDLTIESGADALQLYRFNTMQAEHYFCSRCGIYTHHRRRSNPNQLGVNVACLSGVSPFDFATVPVYEGVRHPSDTPGRTGPEIAGNLRYESSERDS